MKYLRRNPQDYPHGWYFVDETYDLHGPYSGPARALAAMREYETWLLGPGKTLRNGTSLIQLLGRKITFLMSGRGR